MSLCYYDQCKRIRKEDMLTPFRYVYGPVYSWRLGTSLGIDPLADEKKICNMNCSYCQLGKTVNLMCERKEYVSVQDLIDEINRLPNFFADYITFSGRGEPTLALNLGEMIRAIKSVRREKIAVITNSLLLNQEDVRQDLSSADFVLVKLDAANQEMFNCINGACQVNYDDLLRGIGIFREQFKGKFALQIMLLEDNVEHIKRLGALAFLLNPHEVQLSTSLRPCAQPPLGRDRLEKAKEFFKGLNVISCYDTQAKILEPIDEGATIARHGNYRKSRYTY